MSCFSITGIMASTCPRVMTAPVGLFGYARITALVFGVIAASIISGVRIKSFSAEHFTATGVPPARITAGA